MWGDIWRNVSASGQELAFCFTCQQMVNNILQLMDAIPRCQPQRLRNIARPLPHDRVFITTRPFHDRASY